MNNKKLALNSYKSSIHKLLNDLCKSKTPLTLWKICLDRKWSISLQIKVFRSTQNEILFHVHSEAEAVLKEILNGEKTVRFHVESKNILFQCKLRYFYMPELVVEAPKFVAVEDKRKDLRLPLDNESYTITLMKYGNETTTKNKQFCKRLLDVSAGGLSFALSQAEEPYFRNDRSEIAVVISLDKREISAVIKMVNLITVEPNTTNGLLYQGFKACYRFEHISVEDKTFISNFVLKHYKLTA